MGKRAFQLKSADVAEPCPKCGNRQNFVARAAQVAEDCCDVWVTCRCGFDATAEKGAYRLEDVWGSLDPETISMALECSWNDVVRATAGEEVGHE